MSRSSAMTGLSSPVLVWGSAALFLLAPVMRGGNRAPALLVLELVAIALIAALVFLRWIDPEARPVPLAIALLVSSPAIVAALQLLPLPGGLWARLPGHSLYVEAAALGGIPLEGWRALSVAPDLTAYSLLAALPVAAALLAGFWLSSRSLRAIAMLIVATAVLEVALGLAQVSQGQGSPLLFGVKSVRPVGTFANGNHLAAYLCMALALVAWLAFEQDRRQRASSNSGSWSSSSKVVLWGAAAVVLLLGVFLTQSRGALVLSLPFVAAAWALAGRNILRDSQFGALVWPAIALFVLAALVALGWDYTTTRLSASEFGDSASRRMQLAALTLQASGTFLPFGAGWGTYEAVFPRFQPAEISQVVNHAHMDYAELLFEGGVLFLAVAATAAWAAFQRLRALAQSTHHAVRWLPADVGSAIAGLALLGFLMHSLVDFNMRIPANAMLAAFLAGLFLRLPSRDRPAPGDTVPATMY